MKKLLLLPSLAIGLLAASPAKADTKVAYIDTLKAVEGYYRTQDVRNQMKKAEDSFKQEMEGRSEGFVKLQGEINNIQKELQKPELSDQAKKKKAEEGQGKLAKLQEIKTELEAFARDRQNSLREQLNRMMKSVYDDIEGAVKARVKTDGYDLVLDKSAAGRVGFPVVIYADPTADLTEKVLADLNKNAPKDAPAKAESGEAKSEAPAKSKKK